MATTPAEGSDIGRLEYAEVSMETEVLSESDIVRGTESEAAVGDIQTTHLSVDSIPEGDTGTNETDIPNTVGSLLGDESTEVELMDQSHHESGGDAQSTQQTEPEEEHRKYSHEPPLSMSSPSSLPTQENIVTFAEKYSLNLASRRFNVPVATIKKWMKSSRVPLKPKYNSPGQGRKISYSIQLEQEMVAHIRDLLTKGEKVTMQSICTYARARVQEEIPEFTASTGWAHRFLTRNNIDLTDQKDQRRDGLLSRDARSQDSRGRPLSYSVETDQAIANYVRQRLADSYSLTNSELRRYAKDIIIKENPKFTGSASWAQNFLHRHKINLQGQDSKESASTSPSPTVPSRVSPSLSAASPSTSLLSTSLLNSQAQAQYVSSVLTSSPHFTSTVSVVDSHLNPATEMHVVASSTPGFPNPSLSDGVMNLPAEYATDDPMKQALAILTGENIDAGMLSAAQVASLQSTLSEITSDTVSLVDLLNTAQQLHEQSGESGSAAAHLISHGLDSPASSLYLSINTNSDVFGSGLTGAAATQVNPNTQAPTIPKPPRPAAPVQAEMDASTSSRPLSYAKETDLVLAKWVQEQQAAGKKVTFASLRAYAKNLVSTENPNFNASVGWVTPFLLRHGLDLSINKKKYRKMESPQDTDDGQTDQPSNQTSPSVHHIMQEEQSITPEQMMVPVQVVQSQGTPDASMMATPVTSCSPATLEGIRAVLEQGIQNCTQTEQMQFAAQLQEQSLALAHTATSLSHQVDQALPDIHVANIDSQVLAEGRPQRSRLPPRKFSQEDGEEKISIKKRVKGQRNRHRLAEKLDVVRLMREHNLAPHYVCRMLGIANSTLAGWIKLVQQKGAELEALSLNKKRSNLSGQGRPLTYSREKDEAIAHWVQTQQKLGIQVMPAELAKHAQSLIREENHNFTASSGWAQKFLQRHGLQLAAKSSGGGTTPGSSGVGADKSSPAVVEDQHEIPAAVQTEEVIAHEYSQEKPYSDEAEKHLVAWVKENVSTNGSLSLQELCRYAEEVVIPQNPMFVASLSWVFMFLYTHTLLLDPKPSVASVRSTSNPRKRTSSSLQEGSDHTPQTEPENTPKKPCPDIVSDASVSPSTGNLCEALLALSNQSQDSGQPSTSSVQAVLQVALRALHQQQQQKQQLEVQAEGLVGGEELAKEMESEKEDTVIENIGASVLKSSEEVVAGSEKERVETVKAKGATNTSPEKDNSSNTYFGKSAREFTSEEKEEVVRYANATTLQKAAIKYGVAAPTVWRWRVELKLHQPKYSAMQKKYIIKFAETNSLKEAAQRYGITGKTISNWRKALQADGELSGEASSLLTQESQADVIESSSGDSQTNEVVFHFIVDGGEVVEVTGTVAGSVNDNGGSGVEQGAQESPTIQAAGSVPLEVTNEVDIENVGMEYDVVSSEGHVAKPRCTPQEKVQILQYALDHSIKEASQKFGVSPGTLYYWKRSRNSSKESNKETLSSQGSAPDQALAANSPVVEYSDVMDETNVLASNSEDVVVRPEQFIVTSDALSSASDAQTATIQTLSQALAGMSPDALQTLNPDLTLLHAVSSFLTGGGGEAGGGGGVDAEEGTTQRRDSNSEGISSPTEVLVRPFPPQHSTASNQEGGEAESMEQSGVEESQMEEITPDVISEEVVMIGGSVDEASIPAESNSKMEQTLKETTNNKDDHVSQSSSNDAFIPVEPVSTVAMTSDTAEDVHTADTDGLTSSDTRTRDQLVLGTPVELEVLTFPPNSSSLSDPSTEVVGDIPLVQDVHSPSTAARSTEQAPSTESIDDPAAGDNEEVSVTPAEGSVNISSVNGTD